MGGEATYNSLLECAGCNGGYAVMSDEANVHFIALPIEFDGLLGPFTNSLV